MRGANGHPGEGPAAAAAGVRSRLVLVLGGARSGKSLFVERCVARAFPERVVYYATAGLLGDEATDAMLARRFARLASRRPPHWTTLAPPSTSTEVIAHCRENRPSALIVDSFTLWLSERLLAARERYDTEQLAAHLESESRLFIQDLLALGTTVFVVSNDVGLGVTPTRENGRLLRDSLGGANQLLSELSAVTCDLVAGNALLLRNALGHRRDAALAHFMPVAVVSPEWLASELRQAGPGPLA